VVTNLQQSKEFDRAYLNFHRIRDRFGSPAG